MSNGNIRFLSPVDHIDSSNYNIMDSLLAIFGPPKIEIEIPLETI